MALCSVCLQILVLCVTNMLCGLSPIMVNTSPPLTRGGHTLGEGCGLPHMAVGTRPLSRSNQRTWVGSGLPAPMDLVLFKSFTVQRVHQLTARKLNV